MNISYRRILIPLLVAVGLAGILLGYPVLRQLLTSSYESRLAPIAYALSFTEESDLKALGLHNGPDLEVPPNRIADLLERIRGRVLNIKDVSRDSVELNRYRYFFHREDNPEIQRLRVENGWPRLFLVTVYAVDQVERFDPKTSPSFSS